MSNSLKTGEEPPHTPGNNNDAIRHFNLSYLKIAIVTGEDSSLFLQGQLSNDINHLSEDSPHQLSAYCTPKGRVLASFDVLKLDQGYALIAPEIVLDKVLPRLRMFVMRAAVKIELAETLDLIGLQLHSESSRVYLNDLNNMGAKSYQHNNDPQRYFLLVDRSVSDIIRENPDRITVLNEKHWQSINIRQNLPEVFEQTIEAFIPQSINLDLVNGVNFKKGCYPGQEIIARVKYRGKPKTRMIVARTRVRKNMAIGFPVFIDGRESPAGMISHLVMEPEEILMSVTVPVSHLVEGAVYLDQSRSIKIERLPCPYEIVA